MSALQLSEAKAYLNIQGEGSDDKLQGTIDAAESAIAQRVGAISSTTIRRRIKPSHSGYELVLPVTPALSLTSVTPYASSPLTPSDLYLNTSTGVVTYDAALIGFPALYYDVVYQAGRATVPSDLLEAIKILVEHMWQPQRGPRSASSGDGSEPSARAAALQPGASHALPYRVTELIAPHVQAGIA